MISGIVSAEAIEFLLAWQIEDTTEFRDWAMANAYEGSMLVNGSVVNQPGGIRLRMWVPWGVVEKSWTIDELKASEEDMILAAAQFGALRLADLKPVPVEVGSEEA